jgi:hypothetical protein
MSFFHQVNNLPYTSCQRCNLTENVYIVAPVIPESDVGGFLCPKCLEELALFAGYVKSETHDSVVTELEKTIAEQEAKIEQIPNLMEKVIDGANNLLADFVVSVASITSADKPVQPKSVKPNTPNPESGVGSSKAKRREHEPNNISSVKLTE